MAFFPPLMLAEMAVKHVEEKMTFGALNKPEDESRRNQKGIEPPFSGIDAFRLAAFRAMMAQGSATEAQDPRISNLCSMAKFAEQVGMGNCGEQAAIAFRFLIKTKSMEHVGQFVIIGRKPLHEIVVLGLTKNPPEMQFLNLDQYPSGWTNAVVCDPWYHDWFKVSDDWGRRIGNIIRALERKYGKPNAGYRLQCLAYHSNAKV